MHPFSARDCKRSTQPARTSSVHTLKLVSVFGPNVLLMATSEASRPRAINTLPMPYVVARVEGVPAAIEECPNHAAKSIGPYGGADIAEIAGQ
jgi:hypothetical protein